MKRMGFVKISANCYIIGKSNYENVKTMMLASDKIRLEESMIKKNGVITITEGYVNIRDFESDSTNDLEKVKEAILKGIDKHNRSLMIVKADQKPCNYPTQ